MLTSLFVAARIVAGPISNVLQKQLTQKTAHPVFIIGVTHALLALMCLPLLFAPLKLQLGATGWANMVLCALLAVAGNVLLVSALKSTDLSILGPLNAYKSLISVVLGIFVIGESPTAGGAAGVLLILAGSPFVIDREADQPRTSAFVRFFRDRGVRLRFAALGLSATEAVFLKKVILLTSPLTTFVLWSMLGLPIAAVAIFLVMKGKLRVQLQVLRHNLPLYVWVAVATGLMQLATLLTFGRLQVGYSLALFQLSTFISVLLGQRYFREGNTGQRLFGAAVMGAGAAMIAVFGAPS